MQPGTERDGPTSFESQVRSQLERILAHGIFTRSERLSAFLRFITEQTLAGQSASLKEQVLGSCLYAKGAEFDGAADPIVRVDARRLRDKLREYYAEFPLDPILISLPKGRYVPVLEENSPRVSRVAAPSSLEQVIPVRRGSKWLLLVRVAAGTMIALGLVWYTSHRDSGLTPRAVQITSFPGEKGGPAISPDGNFVAFASAGPEGAGAFDLWVKDVSGQALRRLTDTPEFSEASPVWSPDGSKIAFVRDGHGVFILPQTGGQETRVFGRGTHVGWAPDGQSVVIRDNGGDGPYVLSQLMLENLERRQLTRPSVGVGDSTFSVSPDGSNLAFIRYEHPGVADLFVVSMQGGEPRRLTNWSSGQLQGLAWTPDGRELIYSNGRLWRVPADAAQPTRGRLIEGLPESANYPSVSRPKAGQSARLAFAVTIVSASFRRVDLAAPLYKGWLQTVIPFVSETNFSYAGPFSPDGAKFMFVSGPPVKLSVANADASWRREVISPEASQISSGSWSPDGQRLVYDAAVKGNNDIYVVDITGRNLKRLTRDAAIDGVASWSRDGAWIYFTSTRAGAVPDIWRIPAQGGEAVRITYHGGIYSQESPDGKYLYYADRPRDGNAATTKLMRVPVGGGPEIALQDRLTTFWWRVARSGIYFIRREADFDAIDRYEYGDGRVVRVGRLSGRAGPIGSKMTVSPDERWALVPQENRRSDLMLLDNFR